jgi:hypothetical protein
MAARDTVSKIFPPDAPSGRQFCFVFNRIEPTRGPTVRDFAIPTTVY